MTCPTKSIKLLCFLSFRMNIQCYSLELKFHLDVNLWFLNFFKFYFFSLLLSWINVFFRKVTCFEINTFYLMWWLKLYLIVSLRYPKNLYLSNLANSFLNTVASYKHHIPKSLSIMNMVFYRSIFYMKSYQ
jgi:hypothetical protein